MFLVKNIFFTLVLSILIFTSCISHTDIEIRENDDFFIKNKIDFSDEFIVIAKEFEEISTDYRQFEEIQYLYLELSELEDLLSSEELGDILNIKRNDDICIYEFCINNQNYMNLKEIFPILENENFYIYSAKYNSDKNEEEYIELLDFVFGEDFAKAFEKSKIYIEIKSDKEIINTEGFKTSDKQCATLEIKAIDFALLKNDIKFSLCIKN